MSVIFMASLKGSALLLVAWMSTRALRRGSAAARHLIWASALGGMLLTPLLSGIVPAVHMPALPRLSISAAPPATAVSTAPLAEQTSAPRNGQQPTTARSVADPTLQSSAPDSTRRPIDLARFFPVLWALGAALLFLRLAVGTIRVFSWSRRARPVDDGGWLSLVQRLAGRLHIGRPVILLRSERACVPMTWGVVYPTVLLPIDADEWTDERRTIVLLHELAHVKRLDAFTQLVAHVATGLFWFNPLVWLAARQMRREREHACDDFVLEGGARASDYAQDLLQIARSLGSSSAPAAAALAMARRGEFEGRLLAILDPHANRRNVSRARLAVATLAVVVLALPLAALAPAEPLQASPIESPVRARQAVRPPDALPATPVIPSAEKNLSSLETDTGFVVAVVPRDDVIVPAPLARLQQQTPPDRETLISVARAASKMTSDYEKAELLIVIAKYYVRDDELRTIYLDAVSSMTSDYERSRTLTPLLLKDSLPLNAVAQVVKIAAKMTSDNERAALIVTVATDNPDLTPAMRTALISATTSMSSDYDRGRALQAIAKRGGLSTGDVIGLINSAGGMTSSYAIANALVDVASRFPLSDPAVRKAYFKASESITSPSDYRRALAGVLK
ncbi:MAG: peptidase BlaR1 [Gemmatimonadetes bacterium]|nr:peptidase BlaR1 [Gemmatimonadota bacterium]